MTEAIEVPSTEREQAMLHHTELEADISYELDKYVIPELIDHTKRGLVGKKNREWYNTSVELTNICARTLYYVSRPPRPDDFDEEAVEHTYERAQIWDKEIEKMFFKRGGRQDRKVEGEITTTFAGIASINTFLDLMDESVYRTDPDKLNSLSIEAVFPDDPKDDYVHKIDLIIEDEDQIKLIQLKTHDPHRARANFFIESVNLHNEYPQSGVVDRRDLLAMQERGRDISEARRKNVEIFIVSVPTQTSNIVSNHLGIVGGAFEQESGYRIGNRDINYRPYTNDTREDIINRFSKEAKRQGLI